jgi:hypothetical protein
MGKQNEKISVILDGLDDKSISSILTKWKEIAEVKKELEELEIMLRAKVRAYLKERRWSQYKDEATDINVTLSSFKTETIDKKQLKLLLNEAQYAQVLQITTSERLTIVTPEAREKLKDRFGKKEGR